MNLKNKNNNPSLTFDQNKRIDKLLPNQTAKLEFIVSADKRVKKGTEEFIITATEYNGFDPLPITIKFETNPFKYPKIEFVDYGIVTANGDNVITPGEMVDINLRFANNGEGKA